MEKFKDFEKNYKTFTGWLMRDPEIKYFESSKVCCQFTIPLKKNKDDEPIYLNCETWNPILSETISERYLKGAEITVMGYFIENEYNGKKYLKFNVKIAM